MRKKIVKLTSVILFLLLILSSFDLRVIAAPLSEINLKRERGDKDAYKRVIADEIDEAAIKLFESKGCLVKHRLKRSASFECPQEVAPKLNVRESRIFKIMDLEADKQIGADKVWAEGINGSGVKVAVLDTGIDTDHPELQDSYLGGYDYVNNGPVPEDDHGHGTHVAGIISSNGVNKGDSKGVAPGAGIYMYKVCNSKGSCYEDDMMAAMEAAVTTNAKVMSISIGGGSYTTENCDSDPLAAKVNWVVSQGLTVAVAAGNDGRGVSSPGCASQAVAVGANDKSNNVVWWSGRGLALDILAPGVDIYSTYLNGGYGSMSGTSMSTPHVSGVVALLLETDPSLSTAKIKTALYKTASPVNKCYQCTRWWGSYCFSQSEVTCTSKITGAGVVNAYGAYLAVKPSGPACSSNEECGDGLYCNGVETCVGGVCQAGASVDCSALSDQCNDGVCDESLDKCVAKPKANGTGCEDGLFCTLNDYCSNGSCVSGSPKTCDDSKECTIDSCDEESNVCVNEPVADNTKCAGGLCCSGICAPATCSANADCNDGNVCTIDTCNNPGTCAASCSYQPITACINSDGCCPAGCDFTADNDCPEIQPAQCWSGDYQYLLRDRNQARKFCKCAQGTYGYNSYSYSWGRKTVYQYVNTSDNENWEVTSRSYYLPVHAVTCTDGVAYSTNKNYFWPK